jgi:iron complex transport system substrate-binding protein
MKTLTISLICFAACAMGCRRADRAQTAADGGRMQVQAESGGAGGPGLPPSVKIARGFDFARSGDTILLHVHRPWQGSSAEYAYRLIDTTGRAGDTAGRMEGRIPDREGTTLRIPVRRAVTLTTTNLPHLEAIGAVDALVGLGGGRYACSPEIRARLASGRIRDVGEDVRLDLEALLSLRPDVVFTYVVGNSSDGGLAKLSEAGIPAVVEGSYMEESPLGRAEWIKFTAAFFGKAAAADSVFNEMERAYDSLAALAKTAKHRPKVVVGAPFGGIWWVPTGRTYVGRLLADAGAEYPWASDTTRGSLSLDVEAVLGRDGDAEVWLDAGDWKDLADAKAKDPRIALFRAWKDGRVYASDGVVCGDGGRDFYETGAARPDLVLADLIAILHPELMPGHAPRWYRRLPGAR